MLILLLILLPMAAAPVLFALAGRDRAALRWGPAVITGAELILSVLLMMRPCSAVIPGIMLGGLRFGTGGFQNVYSLIASVLWLGATLFSREYFLHEPEHLRSYWAFQLLTLGAVQGLFLSADFMTAFCFFELLSLCSFPWVMHTRTAGAIRAGCTYLAVSVIGGLILFMGLVLLQVEAGTLAYADLPGALTNADSGRLAAAQVCMLLGFGAKAGMFPLHIWLPKAHPVAPAPSSALLSGMLTKAGIYGVLMMGLYAAPERRGLGLLVLVLGLITMAAGAVLALLSVDLKRTLACSSMSQIGFILTGISAMLLCRAAGDEEAAYVALNGALLHMVNHSLLKLVLFLSAGAAAMNLHTLDLNQLRGWGRNKHLLKFVFLIAALGISGVPGFCGYLSKTLLHDGLTEAVHAAGVWAGAEWIFLISGGLTLAYMTKLFICLFVEKNADPVRQAEFDRSGRFADPLSSAVLVCSAALLLPMGVPRIALALGGIMSGEGVDVALFSLECLAGAGISLAIGAGIYVLLVRTMLCRGGVYRNLMPGWLDLEDSVYRPLLLRWLPAVLSPIARLFGENLVLAPLCRGLVWLGGVLGRVLANGTDGLLLLLRTTLLREVPVRDRDSLRRSDRRSVPRRALVLALSGVVDNFSFAMMIACAGIVLVFLLMVLF